MSLCLLVASAELRRWRVLTGTRDSLAVFYQNQTTWLLQIELNYPWYEKACISCKGARRRKPNYGIAAPEKIHLNEGGNSAVNPKCCSV